MDGNGKYDLVEVVKAVEAVGDELVEECVAGDVRDAVVHVQQRLAVLRGLENRRHPPRWTLRDEYEVGVLLKVMGRLVVERASVLAGASAAGTSVVGD